MNDADWQAFIARVNTPLTQTEARGAIAEARRRLGPEYKAIIRDGWYTGHYHPDLKDIDWILQRVRNQFGPAWLNAYHPEED